MISRYFLGLAACAAALGCALEPAAAQDHAVLAPGAVASPAYEGASAYRVLPIPIIDASIGRFFINTVDGLGIDVITAGALTIGGSVDYVAGYRRRDAPDGVGRLPDTAGGRLFATYSKDGVRLTVGGTQSIGGTHGVTADATLSYTKKLSTRFSLTPSVATTWADGKYNDRYFGIDDHQSQESGLGLFAPGSGFKDVSAGLTAKYSLSRRWIVIASAADRGLLGHDADSPIVERKWRPLGSVGFGYVL